MSTWGVDLWDNRDNIEKHTLNGIEFLDKCSGFIKDRIRIEQEYAKNLRRLVKQYQFRKKEDLPFTYQESFKAFLNETDDFAGQREVIAENMQENVLNKMQKLASDLKADRKKAILTLNDHKANLDQLQKAMQVAKKKYEQASEDANNAMKSYETASQSLDLTKAQILKFQKVSQEKGHLAEKASDEYKLATDNFNKAQTLFYEGDLPKTINNELQKPEETRIEMLKNFFIEVSNIQQKVQPIISRCLEGMVKAAEICNPAKDSLTLIDMHKTGNSVPGNVAFEEWGKPNASTQPAPAPIAKTRQKTTKSSVFAMSSKKKDVVGNENVANDYSDLPPAQRKKKFNKAISTLNDQIEQLEKARAGMIKIADTSKQFGGDMASIHGQIESNSKETEKLKNLLHQYNCYLSAMDSSDPKNNSRRSSVDDLPPPPVEKQADLSEHQLSPGFTGDFDDEMRCTVIYDFSGNNEGELTVYAGEELIVIEEDDGSGWTRVMRGQEEGYIPTSYVQNI
ncbi:formin-binding protein 1-like isoform X2 [Hydra vulgaris]|uniref:Formin-binding protein 1-like isoform X2 n=1 Tax=Hydra vulgaris TaxID=6087 RepID=A0ABM4BCW9_HYDVU